MLDRVFLGMCYTLSLACLFSVPLPGPAGPAGTRRKTCRAPDGVTIVYSVAGAGDTALVFVHGGLADRSFFDGQLVALAGRYRVIALDLAGHGDSGRNRKTWGLPQFGGDIKAVVSAEKLRRAILFGNSLGGPSAVEAALLLPGTVIGVVGIDTFQRLDYAFPSEELHRRAEAFRADYAASMKAMVKTLFHQDASPPLIEEAEQRMMRTSPATAYAMFLGMIGYDMAASVRRLTVPLRAINGDLFETDVQAVRKIKSDFDAVVMTHVGHYPMLEQAHEFNRLVAVVAEDLIRRSKGSRR